MIFGIFDFFRRSAISMLWVRVLGRQDLTGSPRIYFFRCYTNGTHPDDTTRLPRSPRIVNGLFISGKSSQSVMSVAITLFGLSEPHFALKLSKFLENISKLILEGSMVPKPPEIRILVISKFQKIIFPKIDFSEKKRHIKK